MVHNNFLLFYLFVAGHSICKELVRNSSKVESNDANKENQNSWLSQECTWDVPVYYLHIASIKISKAESMSYQERDFMLDRALEDLEKGKLAFIMFNK